MTSSGYDRFIHSFAHCSALRDVISEPEVRGLVVKAISIHLSASPEPLPKPLPDLASADRFIQEVFFGFTEVMESYDSLINISILIGRFPFRDRRVSPLAYLKFHLEGFLHEVYILRERLLAYLKMIERQYRNHNKFNEMQAQFNIMKDEINSSFKGICGVRGTHVHQQRYDDNDLDKLKLFDLLARDDSTREARYLEELREIRKKKKKWIAANTQAVKVILDQYCDRLYGMVFTASGDLDFPKC